MSWRDRIAKAIGEGFRAFHGSPHDFDRFDIKKIGTGEGNQTYGHGLYFAENEATARSYRDALKWKGSDWDNPQFVAKYWTDHFGGDRQQAIDYLDNALRQNAQFKSFNGNPEIVGALDLLRSGEPLTAATPKGYMYEVNINADPNAMLDWYKPMRDQPDVLNRVLDRFGPRDNMMRAARASEDLAGRSVAEPSNATLRDEALAAMKTPQSRLGDLLINMEKPVGTFGHDPASKVTGERFYNALSPQPWTASETLREAGVPGIKYLDQGSRTAGTGTYNYVVNDDSLIDIVKKYGLAGAAPVGMGALAAQDQYGAPQ